MNSVKTKKSQMDFALSYAGQGWPVVPLQPPAEGSTEEKPVCSCEDGADCHSPGKHPVRGLIYSWKEQATTDPETIRDWWTVVPNANIGILTGEPSGVDVLDADSEEGIKALEEMGLLTDEYPRVRTGRGVHVYVSHEGLFKKNGHWLDGLDVKTTNGYVVAPPSTHKSGAVYEWVRELNGRLPGLSPEAKVRLGQTNGNGRRPQRRDRVKTPFGYVLPERIEEGTRNDTLFRYASWLRANYKDYSTILAALKEENRRCVDKNGAPAPLDNAELISIAESATRYPLGSSEWPTGLLHDGMGFTDEDWAQRLANLHQGEILYAPASDQSRFGRFYAWDKRGWLIGEAAENLIKMKFLRMVRTMREELEANPETAPTPEHYDYWLAQFDKRRNAVPVKHVLSLLKPLIDREPTSGEVVSPDLFDQNRELIATPSGQVINLRTGEEREMRPSDYTLMRTRVDPGTLADCPRWLQALDEWTLGDEEYREYLHRYAGMGASGDTYEKAFFILKGNTNSGKSRFLEAIAYALGDYAVSGGFDMLTSGNDSERNRVIHMAKHARWVIGSEGREGDSFDAAKLKQMTGGDTMVTRELYGEASNFIPQWTISAATNEVPYLNIDDAALLDRLRILPFDYEPPNGTEEPLQRIFEEEAPGILRWLIEGAKKWYAERLGTCQRVEEATRSVIAEQDKVGRWLEEECELVGDPDISERGLELHQHFVKWCEAVGVYPVNLYKFYDRLRKKGLQDDKGRQGRRFKGIRLKTQQGAGADEWVS